MNYYFTGFGDLLDTENTDNWQDDDNEESELLDSEIEVHLDDLVDS